MRRTVENDANHRTALGLYDGLFWGGSLVEAQACDLRALARVFDLDAGPEVPLAEVWRRVRPFVASSAAGDR